MTSAYVIVGWMNAQDILVAKNAIETKFKTRVLESADYLGRRSEKYIIRDNYPIQNEFNKTCTLNLYDRSYQISDGNVSHGYMAPFTLSFPQFYTRYNRTSLPMLQRTKEIYDIIKPLVSISVDISGTVGIQDLTSGASYGDNFLPPDEFHNYVTGFCSIDNKLDIIKSVIQSPHLYRNARYEGGIITMSPYGIGYSNENPSYYFDDLGNAYEDEFLAEMIGDKYREYIIELKSILRKINLSISRI